MNQDRFERIKSILKAVPEVVGELLDEQTTFAKESQADEAFGLDGKAALVLDAQAGLALTNASDHLFALERALTPPLVTLAPWTIARGMLEASAVILWELDPHLDAVGQLSRSMTMRLDGLVSQRRFARQTSPSFPKAKSLKGAVQRLEARINTLIQQANALGISVKRDKNGNVIGFGEGMPTTTNMINAVFLHGETSFRMLSAVAHGEIWAVQQVGYRVIGGLGRSGAAKIEQNMSLKVAQYLIFAPLLWYSAAAERCFSWNGWDVDRLTNLVDAAYKKAGVVRQIQAAGVYPRPPGSR